MANVQTCPHCKTALKPNAAAETKCPECGNDLGPVKAKGGSQLALRAIVMILGLLGAASCAFVFIIQWLELIRAMDAMAKAESVIDLARALGEDVSVVERGRMELIRLQTTTYLFLTLAILSALLGTLVLFGKRGLVPGFVLLAGAAAPVILLPKAIIFTSPLILTGGIALLIRKSPKAGPAGAVGLVFSALGVLVALSLVAVPGVVRYQTAALEGPRMHALREFPSGGGGDRPNRRERDVEAVDAAGVAGAEPAFRVTAPDLYKEYQADADAAHKKYSGKVIEVSGVVQDCMGDEKTPTIVLGVGKWLEGVTCGTAEKASWTRHGRGQKVRLKGAWAGSSYGLALVHCVILEADPNPTFTFTTTELAKLFETDSYTASELSDKSLIVEGDVFKKEEAGAGPIYYLKGTDKTTVACMPNFHSSQPAIPIGQRVKMYGYCVGTLNDNEVRLHGCYRLTGSTTAQAWKGAVPIVPYRETIKDPAKIAEMIDKAGAGLKFAPLEFKLAGVDLSVQAPEGARIEKAQPGEVEIRYGKTEGSDSFRLHLYPGRLNLTAALKRWIADPSQRIRAFLFMDDDLVLRRTRENPYGSWRDRHHFVATRSFGFLNVRGEEGEYVDDSLDNFLLMIKVFRSLAAKPGYKPPETLEELTKLGLKIEKDDGRVTATVGYGITEAAFAVALKHLADVQELTLYGSYSAASLQPLVGFKKLRSLDISGDIYPDANAGLEPIGKLKGLEKLTLSYCGIDDAGVQQLKGLTNLKELNLRGNPIVGVGCRSLAGMTKLERLEIGSPEFSDAGLRPLGKLTGLKELNLSLTRVSDAGLQHLAPMVALEKLDLYGTPVTGSSLKHLKDIKTLKELRLTKSMVTDDSLALLKGAPALESLSLDETPVTDAGLKHLAGLPALRYLFIGKTAVTDAGLPALYGMKTLRLVSADGTKVTKEAHEKLEKALEAARGKD